MGACPENKKPVMFSLPRGGDGQLIIEDGRAKYLERKVSEACREEKSRTWLSLMIPAFIAASNGNLPRARELAMQAGESDATVGGYLVQFASTVPQISPLG